jgi:signal transduction histidine kinase
MNARAGARSGSRTSHDDRARTVLLKTYAENGRAVVSVTDTGCGMSEEFVRTFSLRLSIGERT